MPPSKLHRAGFALVICALFACAKTKAAEPGALPKPVDQMTGDELYQFTHGLTFGGGVERQRRCRGNGGCQGPQATMSADLRIDAVEQEDSLSVGDLADNGVVAGRVLNRGAMADSMYDTQPGKQFEYYLIVRHRSGDAGATWKLEQLLTTAGARSHTTIGSGIFRGCGHPFAAGARADFKTCAQAASTPQPTSFDYRQVPNESPIWFGCAAGCCTIDTI